MQHTYIRRYASSSYVEIAIVLFMFVPHVANIVVFPLQRIKERISVPVCIVILMPHVLMDLVTVNQDSMEQHVQVLY